MVGIKDFGMPSCCMNCEMFDGEYGNCDIIGDTQDFEYQWNENRPFDCPLVEAIPKAQYDELKANITMMRLDYEARLKADMVAMLEEIQLEIEELDPFGDEWSDSLDACNDIIQQKINSLKDGK